MPRVSCGWLRGSLTAGREAMQRAVRGWEDRGRIWEALGRDSTWRNA